MKIGLLTIPIETGYGSILQALALKTALKQRGHEVTLIRRHLKKRPYPLKRTLRRLVKKFIFMKWDTVILIDKKEQSEYPQVSQHTQPFVEKYLSPFSEIYYSSDEMKKINDEEYDCIVVGSDQVWRPGCMENICDYFLFQISDSIKKYAYAASLGVGNWTFSNKETGICQKAIQSFTNISVREVGAVKLCEKYLHRKPVFVLDPTLLFDGDFYCQFIKKHDISKERRVCAYILDRSKPKIHTVEMYAKSIHANFIYANNNTEDRQAPMAERIAPSVSSWLDSFSSSVSVITDSFHGMAFAIIFRKPFVVMINEERGAERFYSLLQLFHLEHRIVYPDTDFTNIRPIDWDLVEIELKKMRTVSNRFLDSIM